MSDLDLDTAYDGDLCTVSFRGEARLETAEQFDALSEELEAHKTRRVLLDMSRLDFMDSATAGMLLRLQSEVAERDGALAIYGLRRMVARLLERTGLEEQFPIAATRDEAVALLP